MRIGPFILAVVFQGLVSFGAAPLDQIDWRNNPAVAQRLAQLGRIPPGAWTEEDTRRIAASNQVVAAWATAAQRQDYIGASELIALLGTNLNWFRLPKPDSVYYPGRHLLSDALERQDLELMRLLVDAGADVNTTSHPSGPLLSAAIQRRSYAMVELLLRHRADPNAVNRSGARPLHVAIRGPFVSNRSPAAATDRDAHASRIMELLLAHGADPLLPGNLSPYTRSPLEFSADLWGTSPRLVDLLMTNVADRAPTLTGGDTLLHLAARWGRLGPVRLMLEKGMAVGVSNTAGLTPFHEAILLPSSNHALQTFRQTTVIDGKVQEVESLFSGARTNREAILALLQSAGAPQDPFLLAASGRTNELRSLLAADPAWATVRNARGETPLHWAAIRGDPTTARILIDAGAHLDATTSSNVALSPPLPDQALWFMMAVPGRSPLHYAAAMGDLAISGLLADRGARLDLHDDKGSLPVELAYHSGGGPHLEQLLTRTVASGASRRFLERLLHRAVERQDTVALTNLVRHGAQVNSLDADGKTPFRTAGGFGNPQLLESLLQLGGDINLPDSEGATCLHTVNAFARLRAEGAPRPIDQPLMVDWLFDHGADPARTNRAGQTFLHRLPTLISFPQPDTAILVNRIVARAKSRGADIDAADVAGNTPLAEAVRAGHLEVAEALVATGASIHVTNHVGDTLLHLAVTNHDPFGLTNLSEWLLSRGVEINARNAAGRTALHEWVRCPYQPLGASMVKLFVERGADRNVPDLKGRTPIHEFAGDPRAHYQQVQRLAPLLLDPPANLAALDHEGALPLILALRERNSLAANELIKRGGLPLGLVQGNNNGLHVLARSKEDVEPVRLPALNALDPPPATLEARNDDGDTPLLLAGRHGKVAFATWLVTRGANAAAVDPVGRNFLHLLCSGSGTRPFGLRELIGALRAQSGTETVLQARDAEADTPLLLATRGGNWQLVEALLGAGADVMITNRQGETPLFIGAGKFGMQNLRAPGASKSFLMAASQGDLESVTATLRAEPRLGTNATASQALELAVRNHRSNVVARLLDLGAPLTASAAVLLGRTNELAQLVAPTGGTRTDALNAMLLTALYQRRSEEVIALLEAGASIDTTDSLGRSTVYHAERANQTLADELRRRGARDNVFDAVARGDTNRLAQLLAARPVALHQTAPSGHTVVSLSVVYSNLPVAAFLLAAGAEAHRPAMQGVTPVHLAARLGDRRMLELLRTHGAPLDVRDEYGLTPLHCAAMLGRQAATEFLLEQGCNPNDRVIAQPPHPVLGQATPLHLAARYGRTAIIGLLLRHGADRNINQWQGLTVSEFVRAAELINSRIPEASHPPLIGRTGGNAISHLQTEANREVILRLLKEPESASSRPGALARP